MFLELQLTSSALAQMVISRLRSQPICVPDEFEDSGMTFVVDHVEIDEESTTMTSAQGLAGPVARIRQKVTMVIVNVKSLEKHGFLPTNKGINKSITVLFDIGAEVNNGQAGLRFRISGVDASSLDAQTQQKINEKLTYDQSTVIDLSMLSTLLPKVDLTIANAGVTTDAKGSFMAVRVQLGAQDGAAESWASFFTNPENHLGSNEWCILIDPELLRQGIVNTFQDAFAKSDLFSLSSAISATWKAGVLPGFDVQFSGEIVDACTCAWSDIDVNVDVTIALTFGVPKKGVIRSMGALSHDANAWEEFCCEVTAALFWSNVGAMLLDNDKINFGQLLAGYLIGPLGVFFAAIYAAGDANAGNLNLPDDCTQVNDTHFRCDKQVAINAGSLLGKLEPAGLTGLPQGMLLLGDFPSVKSLEPAFLECAGSKKFEWGLQGDCSSDNFAAANRAGFSLTNSGQIPLTLCVCEIRDDPQSVYSLTYESNGQSPNWSVGEIQVSASVTDAFLAAPYPCKIHIRSNGGARIITLPPAQDITAKQEKNLLLEKGKAKADCLLTGDGFSSGSRLHFNWKVDPGRVEERFAHLWQIVATKVLGAERIQVIDQNEQLIAVALPNHAGFAAVTAFFEDQPSGREMGLELVRIQARGKNSQSAMGTKIRKGLFIKQSLLLPRAVLSIQGVFRDVNLSRRHGAAFVTVTTDQGARSYSLSTLPLLDLVGWTSRTHAVRGTRHESAERLLSDQRLSSPKLVATGPGATASLEGDVLSLFNTSAGRKFANLGGETIIDALWVNEKLAVLGPRTLSIYEIGRNDKPRRTTVMKLRADARAGLVSPKIPGRLQTIFVPLYGRGGELFEISSGKLHKSALYSQRPWFDGAATLGRLLVRLTDDRDALVIYEITGSKLV